MAKLGKRTLDMNLRSTFWQPRADIGASLCQIQSLGGIIAKKTLVRAKHNGECKKTLRKGMGSTVTKKPRQQRGAFLHCSGGNFGPQLLLVYGFC